jgi:hypothetical protein
MDICQKKGRIDESAKIKGEITKKKLQGNGCW